MLDTTRCGPSGEELEELQAKLAASQGNVASLQNELRRAKEAACQAEEKRAAELKEAEAARAAAEEALQNAVERQERADEVLVSKDQFILQIMTAMRNSGVKMPGL